MKIRSYQSFFILLVLAGCAVSRPAGDEKAVLDHAAEQGRMMLKIEEAGVKDPLVLEAMRTVPLHAFARGKRESVPSAAHESPLDPALFAFMLEFLRLSGAGKVLQVSTGTGYHAAVLSRMVKQVYTVEILPQLADGAHKSFLDLGYSNISVRCADPMAGWEEQAPFDAIVVTEAVAKVPQALVNQLKEGGRMAVPAGGKIPKNDFTVITKSDGQVVAVTFQDIMQKTGKGE